jgi:hypothetical protein
LLAGPNDCPVNYGTPGISGGASVFNGTMNYVWNNTSANVFAYADVDAEGYGAFGSCFNAAESQFSSTLAFFQNYFFRTTMDMVARLAGSGLRAAHL